MDTNCTIRPESPADYDGSDRVTRFAFGGREEADVVRRLRDAGLLVVSLVAASEAEIIGHVLFSRLLIETDSGTVPAVALGPVAVRPDFQRAGIGSTLIREGLDLCRRGGDSIVLVVGHPDYYPRFGFSPELAKNLRGPFYGEAWMALELAPGALRGISGAVRYPPAWGIDELLREKAGEGSH